MNSFDQQPPKKKLRMSLVCVNCKTRKIKCDRERPACKNCIKSSVGHLCVYETPHWANKTIPKNNSDFLTSSKSQPPQGGIQDEISRLKSIIDSLINTNNKQDSGDDEIIDFFEYYDALIIKRSGMEEHKPLSSMSIELVDPHLLVLLGYANFRKALYRNKKPSELRVKPSKPQRLDSSLITNLKLLGEFRNPELQEVAQYFIQQRLPKASNQDSIILSFTGENSTNIQNLKDKIEQVIPTKMVLRHYLDRFYTYLYPFFPYINKELFNERILNRILTSSDENSPISLVFEDKFDYGILATLILIIRITFISLPKERSPELEIFHQNDINPNFITLALGLLSSFKVLRKTKVTIVQALLYLKVYLSFSPEDNDGSSLTQSQILFSVVTQSAFTIGLNRDATQHHQFSVSKDFRNSWRKLWYGILEIDRSLSTLGGNTPLIQESSYNTQFPELTENDTLIEHEMVNELKKSQNLLDHYSRLTSLVNNVGKKPRLSQILSRLKQMRIYTDLNYSLKDMKLLKDLEVNEGIPVSFINTKKLRYQLQTKSLELTTYSILAAHFESLKHSDPLKAEEFRYSASKTLLELIDIIYEYLKSDYSDYIYSSHLVLSNLFVQNAFQRVMDSCLSSITRLKHTIELIETQTITTDASLRTLQTLATQQLTITAGLNAIMCDKMGRSYYQIFKKCFKFKFLLRSLDREGFTCVKEILDFLSQKYPEDPDLLARLLKLVNLKANPIDTMKEMENINQFNKLDQLQVQKLINLFQNANILKDPEFNTTLLIWEPSFVKSSSSLRPEPIERSMKDLNVDLATSLPKNESGCLLDGNITPEPDFTTLYQILNDGLFSINEANPEGIDDSEWLFY